MNTVIVFNSRVHRDTCKKVAHKGESVLMEQAISEELPSATCCHPNRLPAWKEMVAVPVSAEDPNLQNTVSYDGRGWRRYWPTLGRTCGTLLAEVSGATVESVDNGALTLTLAGSQQDVEAAEARLVEVWPTACKELKVYRKTDADFRALGSDQERFTAEKDFLQGYVEGYVDVLQDGKADSPSQTGPAYRTGYAAGNVAATGRDIL